MRAYEKNYRYNHPKTIMKAKYYIPLMLLMTILSLVGCSDDFDNGNGNDGNEITFTTNISNIPTGKASLYNSTSDLQTEGSFTCIAYNATTTTPYFDATEVTWVGAESKWKFANSFVHYWPGISHLDFFAYMPATKPDYISNITYTTARQPQFTCNMSEYMAEGTQTSLKEFVCALTTDRNKENSSTGVKMKFYHPFSVLKFELDSESGTNVTINSVTLSGLATSGTCTFDGTNSTHIDEYGVCNFFYHSTKSSSGIMPVWSSQSGSANLVATEIDGTTPYLIIPNTYAAGAITITVNATWTGISNTTVNKTATNKNTLTWQPGYSYLFTLKLSGDILIVDTEKFTAQW